MASRHTWREWTQDWVALSSCLFCNTFLRFLFYWVFFLFILPHKENILLVVDSTSCVFSFLPLSSLSFLFPLLPSSSSSFFLFLPLYPVFHISSSSFSFLNHLFLLLYTWITRLRKAHLFLAFKLFLRAHADAVYASELEAPIFVHVYIRHLH